jgi:hypothetical protein
MQTRRILLGALAAPVLLLPACGGHDSVADPRVASAPTSSDSTDPPKRESPEHFIRRWAEAERRMENTGKASSYLRLSSKCTACRQLAGDVRRYYAAGGYVRWGGWKILSIASGGGSTYEVKVNSAPTSYRTSAAAPTQHLSGGPATHQLTVRRIGGDWQVIAKAQLAT